MLSGGHRRHRRRRTLGGILVALAAIVSWDQSGPLSLTATTTQEAAAPTASRSRALGFDLDSLRARLRLPVVAAAEPAAVAGDQMAGAAPVPTRDVAIVPPPFAFERTEAMRPAPAPIDLRSSRYRDAASGGTWALIVGINDYPGIRYDLRSAVNDAEDVNAALAKLGVTNDRRLVLRDRQATADTIRAALDWLTAHTGEDATMVLFFAGHVQKLDAGNEGLVGADGGVIPDAELAAHLDRSPSRRAWIAIASCYSGGFTEVVKPGRILTAAAPSDRVAYENEGFGRSYLVEYMVRRAILGRGITTVEGAFAWASSELQRDFPDRQPVQQDAFGGDLDLKVPPPPSAPPPSGSSSPPPGSGSTNDPSRPPPPNPDDGCANLTVGVVRCN